ncbi:MAG: phosphatidylglycerophosphatase A [Legionella sp.]|nr:phosphatidylglycerophosphatase A [Legionella sp.]
MAPVNLTNKVFQDPIYFIAFGFGSGLMPFAPGTFGTLIAIPLYLLLMNCHWGIYLVLTILAFILGVWVSNKVTAELGIQDYKGIVWDEVVGYLLTMFLAPPGLLWLLLGFLIFRIFDIWKPQPIRFIDQNVKGGLGIMLDDLLAAIPSWLLLHLVAWSFYVK